VAVHKGDEHADDDGDEAPHPEEGGVDRVDVGPLEAVRRVLVQHRRARRLAVALLEHLAAGELVAPGDGDDDHARDQVGHVLRGDGALDEDEQRE